MNIIKYISHIMYYDTIWAVRSYCEYLIPVLSFSGIFN